MGDRVFLNIDTNDGYVVIPFKGLKELDYFTIGYRDEGELIDSLNKLLDLSLKMEDIVRIYISSIKYKYNKNSSLSCIKYSGDNYNVDSLRNMLSLYLRQDHRRLSRCDVRHVITEGMINFKAGKPVSDRDIEIAVKVYLKSDYKKQRDMYFMIKNFGSIVIDKLSKEDRDRVILSEMGTKDEDSFVQYLIELASRGEEELEIAMDELSRVDLIDLSRILEGSKKNIFDGLASSKRNKLEDEDSEDRYALEALTEMSIEQLKELQVEYNRVYGHKR